MLKRRGSLSPILSRCFIVTVVAALGAPYTPATIAQQPAQGCVLPPPQTLIASISDSLDSSLISERTITNVHGQPYREVNVGISGEAEGCTLLDTPGRPDGAADLTDAPDLWFPQSTGPTARTVSALPLRPMAYGPVYRGVARFEASEGSGMTILYPESDSAWNGKLWIVQHGTGLYPSIGELVPRDPDANFNPLTRRNFYAALMVDKAYAVAYIRKDNSSAAPVTGVRLDDGAIVTRSMAAHATLELALVRHAQRFIAERLGAPPRLTYFYGFSGGGQTGHLVNYVPDANISREGMRIVDGILSDDAGAGLPLPVVFRGGTDVLLTDARDRDLFVPQIDIAHALTLADTMLPFQRENGRLLLEKGLGDKHRVYEVLGVSHFDAGAPSGRPESLDLGGLMEAMIDALDQWVEQGDPPPPSRSQGVEGIAGAPVALPEIACPLGVHYAFPSDGPERQAATTTTFVPFDRTGLEPLDRRGELVDMNGNGVRDERESVEEAWRRLGLLGTQETFTADRYAACVEETAVGLAGERLLPWRVVDHYRSLATRFGSGE